METTTANKQKHIYPLYKRVILSIVYLNGGKISETKLIAFLYLLSKKINELENELDTEPWIKVKAKKLDDFYVRIFLKKLIYDDSLLRDGIEEGYSIIILTKDGQEEIYDVLNDCTKEELDAIKEIINQYGKLSEEEVVDRILKMLLENTL
jgi:hypothetical protein